jgi:hypothetical protein
MEQTEQARDHHLPGTLRTQVRRKQRLQKASEKQFLQQRYKEEDLEERNNKIEPAFVKRIPPNKPQR